MCPAELAAPEALLNSGNAVLSRAWSHSDSESQGALKCCISGAQGWQGPAGDEQGRRLQTLGWDRACSLTSSDITAFTTCLEKIRERGLEKTNKVLYKIIKRGMRRKQKA